MPTAAQVTNIVGELSNVGRLVHLAFRYDTVMQKEISDQLFKSMRQQYEGELTRLAAGSGCNRVGLLGPGVELTRIRQVANEHAESIVNTFNSDIAREISRIRADTPTANRNTYASRLLNWETQRAQWKDPQIAMMSYQFAAQAAKEDFFSNNLVDAMVIARPRTAAEPECQRLVNLGEQPIEIIYRHPFPLHLNCPHEWVKIRMQQLDQFDCNDLWLGQ